METVAPAGLRLLSVSRVALAPALPPRQMPVDNGSNVKVKLSFLDVPWVATPPVQEVFLYEKGGGAEYGGMVKRLKESLAASLALYLPLAGKLAYVQETRDIVVDCSDPGVAFFEAEALAGCMDLSQPASDDDDVPAVELASLVPEHDARVLPAPVMVVEATRLNAGLALGVSVHHAVVDGRAFHLFMDAWSSMSHGGASSPVTNKPLSPPNYSREAIAHPSSDELAHEVLSKVAPNLPLANTMEEDDYMSQRYRLRHRTFLLGADDIRTLKRHIDGLERSPSGGVVMANKPVSTFVALSALSWAAFVRAKGLAAGEDTYLVFQVDLRSRLRPPVGAGYIGNCVRGCIASVDAGELLGDMGLLRASRAIQAAVKEAVAAPLDRIGAWMERLIALPAARQANVGGSPLFRVYQTADFGFGMPDKVVPLSMAGSPETTTCYHGFGNDDHGGRIVLSGGKRDGEVRLSVSLHLVLMDAFKNNINNIPIRSRL
ncbi:phenolic glucoside malonyltransferase 2-like [Miscanthus floridulus]|uniref:phenolic glucoside malonyltransferase 2-like n=1 Tax=Miscanthus floridulus TaxID=154761 RepID=UPI003457AAC2